MSHRIHLAVATITVSSILSMTGSAQEATAPAPAPAAAPMGQNVAEMKFVTFPGLPTCAKGSIENGDPGKGPSIIAIKLAAGCKVPWHWHTPNEHLMMVSGAGQLDMKDGKPVTLRPGGYAMMPSHHVHRFGCAAACSLFLHSDGAFDTHYVDAAGKELTPDEALKAVKETPATEMK